MAYAHHHHDAESAQGHAGHATHVVPTGRLAAVLAANAVLGVVQLVGGLVVGSLAVLADAAHQAVDVAGLALALGSMLLARRPPSDRHTFGLQRLEVLGAQLSALLLAASSAWIVFEAITRLDDDIDIAGLPVLVLAGMGLVVNTADALLLRGAGHEHSLATRAALLHLLTDAVASLAVVGVGIVLIAGGPGRIDPLVSLAVSAVVLVASLRLISTTSHILLDAAPADLDLDAVRASITALDDVTDVHHLHVWTMSEGDVAASAHVVVEGERSVHDAQDTLDDVGVVLAREFGIGHATIQLECHACPDDLHAGLMAARRTVEP